MSKFVAYIPGMDSFLMDGDTPFIDSEKEVKRVITTEVVHPKMYELKPVSFLKTWAKRQEKLEAEAAATPYKFSPPRLEFHYKRKEGEKRYLLVVGDEEVGKSGTKVKEFDSRTEALTMAQRSIAGLTKEFPTLGYYVFDTETYGYTDGITANGQWTAPVFGHGVGEGEGTRSNIWNSEEPPRAKPGKRKPKQQPVEGVS